MKRLTRDEAKDPCDKKARTVQTKPVFTPTGTPCDALSRAMDPVRDLQDAGSRDLSLTTFSVFDSQGDYVRQHKLSKQLKFRQELVGRRCVVSTRKRFLQRFRDRTMGIITPDLLRRHHATVAGGFILACLWPETAPLRRMLWTRCAHSALLDCITSVLIAGVLDYAGCNERGDVEVREEWGAWASHGGDVDIFILKTPHGDKDHVEKLLRSTPSMCDMVSRWFGGGPYTQSDLVAQIDRDPKWRCSMLMAEIASRLPKNLFHFAEKQTYAKSIWLPAPYPVFQVVFASPFLKRTVPQLLSTFEPVCCRFALDNHFRPVYLDCEETVRAMRTGVIEFAETGLRPVVRAIKYSRRNFLFVTSTAAAGSLPNGLGTATVHRRPKSDEKADYHGYSAGAKWALKQGPNAVANSFRSTAPHRVAGRRFTTQTTHMSGFHPAILRWLGRENEVESLISDSKTNVWTDEKTLLPGVFDYGYNPKTRCLQRPVTFLRYTPTDLAKFTEDTVHAAIEHFVGPRKLPHYELGEWALHLQSIQPHTHTDFHEVSFSTSRACSYSGEALFGIPEELKDKTVFTPTLGPVFIQLCLGEHTVHLMRCFQRKLASVQSN